MPGYAVQVGATVLCAHAGQATPTAPTPRVLLGNQPIVTMTSPWVVAGCALSSSSLPPCVSAQFLVDSESRLRAAGSNPGHGAH